MNIRVGLSLDFFWRNAVGFGKTMEDVGDESGFVALTAMGHGCHIRAVGFEDDAVEGHGGWQVVEQVAQRAVTEDIEVVSRVSCHPFHHLAQCAHALLLLQSRCKTDGDAALLRFAGRQRG